MALRILIADDHGLVRAGLRSLLNSEPDLDVVGEASTGDETLRLATELGPDLVLLDISMPGATAGRDRQRHSNCCPVAGGGTGDARLDPDDARRQGIAARGQSGRAPPATSSSAPSRPSC